MDCVIFIILTNEHVGLNEAMGLTKGMQFKHDISILTYDLSHYHGLPLYEEDANKIKDIIESMSKYYNKVNVSIVADKAQIQSIKEFFNNMNYDITAYVMRDAIKLND